MKRILSLVHSLDLTCPTWCTGRHPSDDLPEDVCHFSTPRTVAVHNGHRVVDLELEVVRHVREDDSRVFLAVGNQDAFSVSARQAREVAAALVEMADRIESAT